MLVGYNFDIYRFPINYHRVTYLHYWFCIFSLIFAWRCRKRWLHVAETQFWTWKFPNGIAMRPALHANILRNRNQRAHRINSPPRPHTFSMTRLLLMVLIGAIIFIPGIALTVLGFQNKDEVTTNTPAATLTWVCVYITVHLSFVSQCYINFR